MRLSLILTALALAAIFFFAAASHTASHPVTHIGDSAYCKQWGHLYRNVPERLSYCP